MRYSDEIIDEIRSRADIVDVIGDSVSLQRKGNRYWACCPFHGEKTPSFSVNPERQMYYCFGCHASGNVFRFLQEYESMTFVEAIKYLADRYGVALPEIEQTAEEKRKASTIELLREVNKEAAKFFYINLYDQKGAVGHSYLSKRGLSQDTMREFGLGFAGKNGKEVVEYLKRKGFSDEIIIKSGIATHSEKYGTSSQFWNRVMFPIMDRGRKVIGFGGRVMGDGEPKYLNSPENELFNKRKNLYGQHIALNKNPDYYILCEGYMDVISLQQAGFTGAMASLGTAFTEEQAMIIKKKTSKVYLSYDSDGAGQNATIRAIGILRKQGIDCKVISMVPHKDPDEFIKNLGREAYIERIENAINGLLFEAKILAAKYKMSDPDERIHFQEELGMLIAQACDNETKQDAYIESLASQYMIKPENLKSMVNVSLKKLKEKESDEIRRTEIKEQYGIGQKTRPNAEKKVSDSLNQSEALLLSYMAFEPSIYKKIKEYISPDDFTDEFTKKLAEMLFTDDFNIHPADLVDRFEGDEHEKASYIFSKEIDGIEDKADMSKAVGDLLIKIKTNSIKNLGPEDLFLQIQKKKELENLKKLNSKI